MVSFPPDIAPDEILSPLLRKGPGAESPVRKLTSSLRLSASRRLTEEPGPFGRLPFQMTWAFSLIRRRLRKACGNTDRPSWPGTF